MPIDMRDTAHRDGALPPLSTQGSSAQKVDDAQEAWAPAWKQTQELMALRARWRDERHSEPQAAALLA